MAEQRSTFCEGYVGDKRWDEIHARNFGYILIPEYLIETAKKITREKGAKVRTDSEDKSLEEYLYQGLIKINPSYKSVPFYGKPCIELHSETEEGLEKLAKDLGLLYNPINKDVSQK